MTRFLRTGLVSLTVLTSACALAGAADKLSVADPYVRLNPPGTRVTAAYMVLKNAGDKDIKVTKAANPTSKLTELHNHFNEGGVMKMRQVPAIEVKAKGETALQPSGLHVMMIDLKEALKEGQIVPITLTLDDGSEKKVDAVVKNPTAAAPAKNEHAGHDMHKH